FFTRSCPPQVLPSFPTRRSSDLNFRDLGGLPTVDGGATRSGVMFRSDALHHLEPTDVERLLELGMRMVIDLRSSSTLDRRSMTIDRKSTRLNSSHVAISYAVFCL